MAARAKNRKTFKRLFLLNQKMDFEIIIQECFLGDPLPICSNDSVTLNKVAARAINRSKLWKTSSAKSVDRFWNNIIGMFLRWLSTKIAQTFCSVEQDGHQGYTRGQVSLNKRISVLSNYFDVSFEIYYVRLKYIDSIGQVVQLLILRPASICCTFNSGHIGSRAPNVNKMRCLFISIHPGYG